MTFGLVAMELDGTVTACGARDRFGVLRRHRAVHQSDVYVAVLTDVTSAAAREFAVRTSDVHGHEAGDATLERIVADCRKEIRSSDLLGRLGGEKFANFLPASNVDSGRTIAECIRERIARGGGDNGPIACTVSIGVAGPIAADEVLEETIRRADVALYAAKAAGRNRVLVAGAEHTGDKTAASGGRCGRREADAMPETAPPGAA